jgi:hypothetical protein
VVLLRHRTGELRTPAKDTCHYDANPFRWTRRSDNVIMHFCYSHKRYCSHSVKCSSRTKGKTFQVDQWTNQHRHIVRTRVQWYWLLTPWNCLHSCTPEGTWITAAPPRQQPSYRGGGWRQTTLCIIALLRQLRKWRCTGQGQEGSRDTTGSDRGQGKARQGKARDTAMAEMGLTTSFDLESNTFIISCNMDW